MSRRKIAVDEDVVAEGASRAASSRSMSSVSWSSLYSRSSSSARQPTTSAKPVGPAFTRARNPTRLQAFLSPRSNPLAPGGSGCLCLCPCELRPCRSPICPPLRFRDCGAERGQALALLEVEGGPDLDAHGACKLTTRMHELFGDVLDSRVMPAKVEKSASSWWLTASRALRPRASETARTWHA